MPEAKVVDEKVYTVPLRDVKLSSRARRGDTAISVLRDFVARHSHVAGEDVWIDPKVNEIIWSRGRKNVPSKISVKVLKLQDGTAEVIML